MAKKETLNNANIRGNILILLQLTQLIFNNYFQNTITKYNFDALNLCSIFQTQNLETFMFIFLFSYKF